MTMKRLATVAALVAGIAAFPLTQATATETIKLTALDGYPIKSMWVKEFADYFIPEVDKRLAKTGNYKIEWNKAFGGQIVKPRGVLKGIEDGLGDIGVVTTVFHGDKVPLQSISYQTPFATTDPLVLARTMDKMAEKFPDFKKAFEKHNQVYLASGSVLDSYQVYSKSPIKSIDDLKGVKVSGAGPNLLYLKAAGAVGVKGSLVKYYNNLKTGVSDAAIIWPEAAQSFKIGEVAPYMLKADIGTVCSKVVTANKDTWEKLPDEVKQVIQEVAVDYRDHIAKVALDRAGGSMDWFKGVGGEIVEMTDEERAAWADSMPNIAKDWAGRLEEKGIPANEILVAFMEELRASGQTPLRDWDKN